MIRFLFRLLSFLSLLALVALALLDAARSLAASHLVLTTVEEVWVALSPETLAKAQLAIGRTDAYLSALAAALLAVPGSAAAGLAALIFYALGRRPKDRLGHPAFHG